MRKIFILSFFILISTVFASDSLEKVSLQLKWKHAFQFAGYYIAKEKGFYKDVKLDVNIKSYNNQDILNDVVTGKTTYGILDSSIILDKLKDKPIIALFALFQDSPLALMTLKSSNIKTISDLKNKKIMTNEQFFDNPYIKTMFYINNINPKTIINIPTTYNLDSLINKKIDAYAIYLTDQPYTMQQKGIKYNIINPIGSDSNFYSDILFTSKKELDEHPKRVEKFLKASIKGWKYAFNHIDETIKLIHRKSNSQHFSYDKLKYEAIQTIKLSGVKNGNFGKIEKNKLDNIVTMYKIIGEKIKKENLKHLIYSSNRTQTKLSENEKAYLRNTKKVITMCIDPNWMPLEMIKDGRHIGISADYFKLIQQYIGTPIKLIPTKNWAQSILYAKQRKCDILSLVMSTQSRKKYLNFTKPYLSVPLVIATKMDKIFINDIKSIKSKKLGITKDYAFVEILRKKYPYINLIEVNSIQQGLKMVDEGKLYGYIDTLLSTGYEIQKKYFSELKIAGKLDDKWELGIGVRNDDLKLLSILNKSINSITEKQKQKILNYWISIKYDKGFNYNILIYFGFFILVGIIFFVYREKTLSKYNKILEEKNAKLEILASMDMLTGARSRRSFFDIGTQYISIAQRENKPLSFIMMDLDHFKKINDTYGHQTGDKVLKNFAKVVAKNIRKSDLFGRVGGEEFAIILSNTNIDKALKVAEKIRSQVSTNDLKFQEKTIHITVSLGIAMLANDDILDTIFEKADKALYTSKQNGRNRITVVD
ncbi:MAG: diguanylate cyclase [Campylobacteraceae bacterium]|nr:diguanylate cyclase [Campylobacteraceae bacterium]